MRVVNYGGGTNSTALLLEALDRGISVDLIAFADTGSEMPRTYEYVKMLSEWLLKHGMPPVAVVRWIRVQGKDAGKFIPLHEWCEQEQTVPSKAYGFSGCTTKWKQQPVDKFIKNHPLVVAAHARGELVERWIGYDADEPQRAQRMESKNPEPHLWKWCAPLVDWDMGRDECIATIQRHGLPLPGKSACWMCPSSKKGEIAQLGKEHPELLRRSLDMEARAIAAGNLGAGEFRKGLGGRLNWGEFVRTGLGIDPDDLPCGCYDGGPADAPACEVRS